MLRLRRAMVGQELWKEGSKGVRPTAGWRVEERSEEVRDDGGSGTLKVRVQGIREGGGEG